MNELIITDCEIEGVGEFSPEQWREWEWSKLREAGAPVDNQGQTFTVERLPDQCATRYTWA